VPELKAKPPAPESKAPAADPTWTVLFDGNSLDAWQGWKGAGWLGAWELFNGELQPARRHRRPHDAEQFGDFEQLEWRSRPARTAAFSSRAGRA
jgi:hypothetical protein